MVCEILLKFVGNANFLQKQFISDGITYKTNRHVHAILLHIYTKFCRFWGPKPLTSGSKVHWYKVHWDKIKVLKFWFKCITLCEIYSGCSGVGGFSVPCNSLSFYTLNSEAVKLLHQAKFIWHMRICFIIYIPKVYISLYRLCPCTYVWASKL